MMRILVTGASGLLGLNFALAVNDGEHTVVGVANTALPARANFKFVQADLTEPGILERLLEQEKPQLLLHCAALANLEACEADPKRAAEVNAVLPGRMAEIALQHRVHLIHISTDAVFDGQKGGYVESDLPNPLSVYARTKWEGEQAVAAANPNAMIARVNFYGWSMSGNRSLAEFFFNHLSAGRTVKGFTDVFFCPMMVLDLADLLLESARLQLSGTYHLVGPQPMSKYSFGRAIAKTFGFDPNLVEPASLRESGLIAHRSPNLSLDTSKIRDALKQDLPDFEHGLNHFYGQYRNGFPQLIQSMA